MNKSSSSWSKHCSAFPHTHVMTDARFCRGKILNLIMPLSLSYTFLSSHHICLVFRAIIKSLSSDFILEKNCVSFACKYQIVSPSLPLHDLDTIIDDFSWEHSHLLSFPSHLHLSLAPSLHLSCSRCCSVEFSKPSRCCSAQRDGEAEDAQKGEGRKD